MSDANDFFTLSKERITNNIKNKKTIANDPVIDDVKEIIGKQVAQYGEKVFEGKVTLEPKDFEKFAKLYLTIITQENAETADEGQSSENLKDAAKQLEVLKSTSSFEEIKNKMAEMMEEKNQKQLT